MSAKSHLDSQACYSMRECTRPHKLNTAVQRRVRAAQNDTAGRSLPTPKLDGSVILMIRSSTEAEGLGGGGGGGE